MTGLRRALLWLLLPSVAALGLLLAVDNHALVALRFLNFETPTLALFWWLYAVFVGGAVCGFALCAAGFARGKLEQRRLQRALAAREQELAGLRSGAGTASASAEGSAAASPDGTA